MRQCNFDSIQLRFLLRFHDQNHIPQAHAYCPEYHHQPLLFTQQSQTPFRDMYIHKTPPTPPQNTYFPGLKLKVCKIYNYSDIVGRYVQNYNYIMLLDRRKSISRILYLYTGKMIMKCTIQNC